MMMNRRRRRQRRKRKVIMILSAVFECLMIILRFSGMLTST